MTYLHDLWLRYTLPKKTRPKTSEPPVLDLSTPKGYEIAAAIRGPDFIVGTESLKWVFTARIRWLVGARTEVSYGTRQGRLNVYNIVGLKTGLKKWPKSGPGLNHYLDHIGTAAGALGDRNLARLAIICLQGTLDTTSDEDIIRLAGGD